MRNAERTFQMLLLLLLPVIEIEETRVERRCGRFVLRVVVRLQGGASASFLLGSVQTRTSKYGWDNAASTSILLYRSSRSAMR